MASTDDELVVIVGAGISGLRVASLLSAKGIRCVLLDARAEPGGRAASIVHRGAREATFDLGPTWHWPGHQPRMKALVAELGLSWFPQYVDGFASIERFRFERAQQYSPAGTASGTAVRLDDGMKALVDAMAGMLPPGVLRLEQRVVGIDASGDLALVFVSDSRTGARETLSCRGVVVAVPPRLVDGRLSIVPGLPAELRAELRRVPTWLAGQAKAIAVFERPFWREEGHSGLVSSVIGPLQEIHDASPRAGLGALFGFFGLSALGRKRLGESELRSLVVAQLVRLFGDRAGRPIDFAYKDWAGEPHIASPRDWEVPNRYPDAPSLRDWPRTWSGRVLFAGSELAREHAGYMEGALESAEHASALAEKLVAIVTPVPDAAGGGR